MKTLKLPLQTARVFQPLLGPKRYKGAHGGRGSGKSHFFAEAVVELCMLQEGTRVVCVREVQKSLRESVKLLIEDKIEALGVGKYFRTLHDRIETPGNGLVLFQGMADHTKESVKSLEGMDRAYVEESQTMTDGSWEMLRPTIRKPGSEIWCSWNPRSASDPVDAFFRSENAPGNSVVVEVNWRDNPFFPQVLEEDRLYDQKHRRDRYAHIWDGAYEPTAIGAIWSRQIFNQHRVKVEDLPTLERIVVGVDPAVTDTETSDHHGIVVCAKGEDGRGYVLEDGSRKGGPRDWATRVVSLFDKHEADKVIAEVNQGGDLVEFTLKTVRPSLSVKKVRATRGKHVRAEPIASLYEGGRISHCGALTELEDQMCGFTSSGYEGAGSPDRAEAAIWAFTELFPSLVKKAAKSEYQRPPMGQYGWMG